MNRIHTSEGLSKRACFTALAVSLLLAGCSAPATKQASSEGVWQQQGYGQLLRIEDGQAQAYDINAVECHASEASPLADLGEIEHVDAERLEISYGINRYRFERLSALPLRCSESADVGSALQNFDSLWQTFREHYAFFETRDIDWNALRAEFRPRIREDMGEVELYRVLQDMLARLDDGHVKLDAPDEVKAALASSAPAPDTPAGPSRFELGQQAQAAILARYVEQAHTHNAGAVRWGRMSEDVGYVQVNHMLLLADYGVDPQLDMRAFVPQYFERAEQRPYQYRDEVVGARRVIADIVDALKDTRAIILDLRFNGGGKDEAALEFLRPFVRTPLYAFSKQAREGSGFGPIQRIELRPIAPTFDGQLFVLTSGRTASAAEIAVLASRQIPNSLRVGDTTQGIFSDTLDKTLPNGWEYTLSNELYTAPAGEVFEGVGIPPDVLIDYPPDAAELYRTLRDEASESGSGDRAIEAVLRTLDQAGMPVR